MLPTLFLIGPVITSYAIIRDPKKAKEPTGSWGTTIPVPMQTGAGELELDQKQRGVRLQQTLLVPLFCISFTTMGSVLTL